VLTVLATLLVRFGKRGAWRQLGYAVQGWWAGVRNQRGVPDWMAPAAGAEIAGLAAGPGAVRG